MAKEEEEKPTKRPSIAIVYATQTGQSKCIAESLHDLAQKHNFEPQLYDIAEHDTKFTFAELRCPLVFVCSTTGDGETPESSRKVYSKLKRTSPDLSGLDYALLGLGDSNYSQFCNGPKLFHKRFHDLGATCFYGPFWADDGVGMELEVEPFKEGLWNALNDVLGIKNETPSQQTNEEKNDPVAAEIVLTVSKLSLTDETIGSELSVPDLTECHMFVDFVSNTHDKKPVSSDRMTLFSSVHSKAPLHRAVVTSNQVMTAPESIKQCYDVKFTSDDEFEYQPGFAVDVVVANSDQEVHSLLERLNLEHSRDNLVVIKLLDHTKKMGAEFAKISESNENLTLFDLFKYCLDIRSTGLKKTFLRMLAAYCALDSDRLRLMQLASREGSDQYMQLVKETHLSLLDLLNTFSSCRPPLAHLVQMLPLLNTRAYSLCSRANHRELEIVFSVVDFDKADGRTYTREGIATGYLKRVQVGDELFFQKRKFNTFTFPPADTEQPIIMIGPGTGIAPFISLLRELHATLEDPKRRPPYLWLFYGCRKPHWDWLFGEELSKTLRPLLERISITFSRVSEEDLSDIEAHTPGCRYVQDAMRKYSGELVQWIHERNATVYVCGDAKNMAKDVNVCMVECLHKHLGLSPEEAHKYLNDMIKTKRLKQDIWA